MSGERLQDHWSSGFSEPNKFKVNSLTVSKINLLQALMPAIVTNIFDEDSINDEQAFTETAFSHYKYMGHFRRSKAANSVVIGPNWQKY